jgi:hypothetical protein
MAQSELDFRVSMMDSFLVSPHREVAQLGKLHRAVLEQDPLFYGHLAVWAQGNLEVRDHRELFVSGLFVSDLPEHREAGGVLLQDFPPYEVNRIVSHVKQVFGKNVPRTARQAVERYLRSIESNPSRLDGAVTRQRGAMQSLYARLHLKPSERAQKTLFEGEPPEGSQPWLVKRLARAVNDPAEQAKLIVRHDIPFPIAVSVIRKLTPAVLSALVTNMTPQEVLQSVKMLKRHGAMDHPEVKPLVDLKLEAARMAPGRVDTLKGRKAAQAAGVPEELKRRLMEVTEEQLKKYRIRRSTALLVDSSGSMAQAIAMAKELGALISARIEEAELFVYAFDTVPHEVDCRSTSLAEWDRAFRHIRSGGNTSCGIAVQMMARRQQRVEQIVMITDEGENSAPYFKDAYAHYVDRLGARPHVVFVKLGGATEQLENDCRKEKIPFDTVSVPQNRLDYYSMPAILALLSRPSRAELVLEIMSTPLPRRA